MWVWVESVWVVSRCAWSVGVGGVCLWVESWCVWSIDVAGECAGGELVCVEH